MNKITLEKKKRPVKIIQFGGGVFLRGFGDFFVHRANDAGVMDASIAIVRSRTTGVDPLSEQKFNYTHIARDAENNDTLLIDSIVASVSASEDFEAFLALADNPDTEVIVSNTTEAGIVYTKCGMRSAEYGMRSDGVSTFPSRLCALLYRRFSRGLSPMLIVPCELIENNGDTLKKIVYQHARDWELEGEFFEFLDKCSFRNTLVDRIVSGKPTEKIDLGYEDSCVNTSEYFHLFVIEGERDERFPLDKISENIKFVKSVAPYRKIKVRILNGAHTSMIPYALLLGVQSVGECLQNDILRTHLISCLEEIIDSLDGDRAESVSYASDVIKRFSNPYIYHRCDAIVLNSVSKFKVRVLPSILEYKQKMGTYPKNLVFSLAMLIKLYKSDLARDDISVVEFIKNNDINAILASDALWGQDISFLSDEVKKYDN